TRFSRDWSSDVCSSDLPPAVRSTAQQPVCLQSYGQPVRGSARKTGTRAEFGKAARLGGHGLQHGDRLVEDADAGRRRSRGILSRSEERRVGKGESAGGT